MSAWEQKGVKTAVFDRAWDQNHLFLRTNSSSVFCYDSLLLFVKLLLFPKTAQKQLHLNSSETDLNYALHYNQLIDRARNRKLTGWTEVHHILPRSLGGGDELDNLITLTPREHLLAHMLLYKMGYDNQIQAVAAFFPTNPRRPNLKIPKWTRQAASRYRARVFTRS